MKNKMHPMRPVPPGGHKLPPLPYPYEALEPIISARTLYLHHDHHHKSYVEGLNKAEIKLLEARKTGDFSLIKHWERELAFHGSGHILHSIYWTVMIPGGPREPGSETRNYINSYFGSIHAFKEQFMNASVNVEASGWGILVWQPAWNHLEILTAEKHQNLTQWGCIPIMVVDVWEHAYYLDYQYRHRKYVESWWNLINWSVVEKRLQLAIRGDLPLII